MRSVEEFGPMPLSAVGVGATVAVAVGVGAAVVGATVAVAVGRVLSHQSAKTIR